MIPRHSAIPLRVLQEKGYRENRKALWRFEAPARIFTVPGLCLCLGAFPLAKYVLKPHYPGYPWEFISFVIGLVLITVPTFWMLHAVPVNPKTGKRLDIYRQADHGQEHGYVVFIYVDHDDKTYFIRPISLGHSDGG